MERTLEWTSGVSQTIMMGLRKRVRPAAVSRGDLIEEHVGRHWTSWRSRKGGRVFAEIRPLRGRVQVFILPRPRDLRDSSGLARKAPRSQGWGWFRSRIELTTLDGIEPAARLIIQSYEHVMRRENGARVRRSARRTKGL